MWVGSAYGIRPGLSADVCRCAPRASFLVLAFTADRSVSLKCVGVAVRVAVRPGSRHSLMAPPGRARVGLGRRSGARSSTGCAARPSSSISCCDRRATVALPVFAFSSWLLRLLGMIIKTMMSIRWKAGGYIITACLLQPAFTG